MLFDNLRNICVITPYFHGFYLGELTERLRKLIEAKNYGFMAQRTDSYGQFDDAICLDRISGVIVLLNAAHPSLVKRLKEKNIPVVCIGYDYFPQQVPVITSDNEAGITQAFKHLVNLGHTKIGFAGDLSIYDLRKRYEVYLEQHHAYNLELDDERIYTVENAMLQGGYDVAMEYIKRGKNCTAMICGADLTAIGMLNRLNLEGINVPDELAVIGYDSVPLGLRQTPSLTSVNQNFYGIAANALRSLESLISGGCLAQNKIVVEPWLDVRESCGSNEPALVASQADRSGLKYIEGLFANSYETTQHIVNDNLENVMGLSTVFPNFMRWGCFARWVASEKGKMLRVMKLYTLDETISFSSSDPDMLSSLDEFPPQKILELIPDKSSQNKLASFFPIKVHDENWGLLAMFGEGGERDEYCSFPLFGNYMDMLSFGMGSRLYKEQVSVNEFEMDYEHTGELNASDWQWRLNTGRIYWNDSILELLGFQNDFDKNVYRHMEIFDRIHPADIDLVRSQIAQSIATGDEFQCKYRMKNSKNTYIEFNVSGDTVIENDELIGFDFYLVAQLAELN